MRDIDDLLPHGGEVWHAHISAMARAIQTEARQRSRDGMTGIRDDRAFGLACAAYDELRNRLAGSDA